MTSVRVYDPYGTTSGSLILKCNQKIEDGLAVLASHPDNNGNPLLFAQISGKTHILDGRDPENFRTAATNGRQFIWYPKFLAALSGAQVVTLLKHESYHNLLFHPEQISKVEYPFVFNIAADFIVNSLTEKEWSQSCHGTHNPDPENHPLWRAPLGKPITLSQLKKIFAKEKKELLESLGKKVKEVKEEEAIQRTLDCNGKYKSSDEETQKQIEKTKQEIREKTKKDPDDVNVKYTLVDESLLGRTAMDIYKELVEWYQSLDKDVVDLLKNFFTDEHLPGNRSYQTILGEFFRCANMAKNMRGVIPGELESQMKELTDPTLDLSEFTEQTIQKAKINGGNRANNTRFKRRFLSEDKFYPQYMTNVAKIGVLLDTSGSMSDEDIACGTSELQQFIGKAEIFVIPTDATPHWDAITKITKMSEFHSVKIKGRGGTVFDDFFREFPVQMRKYGKFDAIIVITDGCVGKVPKELAPPCPVGWVITSPTQFNQDFGRGIFLKRNIGM